MDVLTIKVGQGQAENWRICSNPKTVKSTFPHFKRERYKMGKKMKRNAFKIQNECRSISYTDSYNSGYSIHQVPDFICSMYAPFLENAWQNSLQECEDNEAYN